MLDAVRSLDGPIGHGTLIAALSRLEALRLVESPPTDSRWPVYRLTILGRVAGRSASILLAARRPTLRDRLDIVRSAIDARLHPQVVGASAQRVATVGDRVLALAAVVVGALFSTWAGLIVVFSPHWGAGMGAENLLALSFGAGLLGAVVATGPSGGLACARGGHRARRPALRAALKAPRPRSSSP